MLEIRLLGMGQMRYNDRPLAGFPDRRCYLLLCYILLNQPHPQPREQLADLFWSEYSSHTSRKYLRNALWQLRKSLQSLGVPVDEYLSIRDSSVSFLTSSSYWLDVEVFEATLAPNQDLPGAELTPEQAAAIEQAVELYTGDLLQSIYEDWCLYERERLFLLQIGGLSKLVDFHEANEDYERGLACAGRILAYDNTRETTHRQMMRLYWLLGDRAAAVAQYQCCVQILRDELGLSPMRQTKRLYEQIVSGLVMEEAGDNSRDRSLPATAVSSVLAQSLANLALQRLRHLEEMIEQTSEEARSIDRLIRTALLSTPDR